MWLYICVSARCGCLHRRACVWECQCPHRWGGGVFGVAEGSVGAFGPQFFWLHGWSMISFLGKPCPVGRSGGMVWVWKLKIEASCGGTNHLNAMEQTWPTEMLSFHVVQSCSVPQFETRCHDGGAIFSPLISSCCITKSSQSLPLHYTTMQVLYLWMKERGGVSFPSTHNPEHWMSSLMKRAGSEICRTWKTRCTVQGGLSD